MERKERKYRRRNPIIQVITRDISLSEEDRIIYVYKINNKRTIREVTNVAYEIFIDGTWVTIIRYDTAHGYLHRHQVISIYNLTDTATTFNIKKKGTHSTLLTWAVEDIKKNYQNYRNGFLKRTKKESLTKNK